MFHNIVTRYLRRNQILVPREARIIGRSYQDPSCRINLARSYNTTSNSGSYKGDGKTTVRVLNDEESHLNVVNTYSANGFRLHNGLFIYGSLLLFPTNVFSWNVKRGKDITMESLMIFDIIVPKTKIVIIGYGQYGEEYDASIPMQLKRKGISCEMLATPNAVTTYNYLVHDSVHVAGAFIPMKDDVKMSNADVVGLEAHKTIFGDRPYFTRETNQTRVSQGDLKNLYMKTVYIDTEKKVFDEEDPQKKNPDTDEAEKTKPKS